MLVRKGKEGRGWYLFGGKYVHVLHAQTDEGGERAHVLQDVALDQDDGGRWHRGRTGLED